MLLIGYLCNITSERKLCEEVKMHTCLPTDRVEVNEKILQLREERDILAQQARLDGCYAIKTDLPKDVNKQIIHDRYKYLARENRYSKPARQLCWK